MKRAIVVAAVAAATLAVAAVPAQAGEWTCRNPAGELVQGECNGVPLVHVNPGGGIPPGQNK